MTPDGAKPELDIIIDLPDGRLVGSYGTVEAALKESKRLIRNGEAHRVIFREENGRRGVRYTLPGQNMIIIEDPGGAWEYMIVKGRGKLECICCRGKGAARREEGTHGMGTVDMLRMRRHGGNGTQAD